MIDVEVWIGANINHLIHGQQCSTVVSSGSRESEQDEETEVWCDYGHAKSLENGQFFVAGDIKNTTCSLVPCISHNIVAASAREVSNPYCVGMDRVNPIKLQMPDITSRSCPRESQGDHLFPYYIRGFLLNLQVLDSIICSFFSSFIPNPCIFDV